MTTANKQPYGETSEDSNAADFRQLEAMTANALAELHKNTPDPLQDILQGLEGEDRCVAKALTFADRYGTSRKTGLPPTFKQPYGKPRTKEEQDELVRASKESTSRSAHTM